MENKKNTNKYEEDKLESKDGNTSNQEDKNFKRGQKSALSEKTLREAFKKLSLKSKLGQPVLEEPTYEYFIDLWKEGKFKKVITLVGAGISTSAGIPDFRSPESGLYDNLEKYNLPHPQAIFHIGYFKAHPEAFFDVARQLMKPDYRPTIAHYFIKLLEIKGLLLRHYTQNVDGLERMAGLSEERLIEAHGTMQSAHCIKCNKLYCFDWMKKEIETVGVPRCVVCKEVVKPDIVFFGESLPKRFTMSLSSDFYEADLLIIMGSSLMVEPFASLVRRVNKRCPRVIINNQEVGKNVGIIYNSRHNTRDVFIKSSCNDGCMKIINSMNWSKDFETLLSS